MSLGCTLNTHTILIYKQITKAHMDRNDQKLDYHDTKRKIHSNQKQID